MKFIKLGVFVALVVVLPPAAKSADGAAIESSKSSVFIAELAGAKTAELPSMAAQFVEKASAPELTQTTIGVVKASVGLNPAAAPAIVGSISHVSPAMAPTAAGEAVALVPNEVLSIARAAATAAPTNAVAIVEAICRVSPGDYREVAEAVAQVVPGNNKQILTAVAVAIPGLTNAISQVLTSNPGGIASMNTMLLRVDQIASVQNVAVLANGTLGSPLLGPAVSGPLPIVAPASRLGSLPQGPSSAPPQVPLTGSDPGQNPGSGTPTTGGHNYSSP